MDSIIGQGVARIQELFKQARLNGPAIIFLDEIDALASDRSLSMSKYNSMELNQLLTEMDGFLPDDKIIVIAATNTVEQLDKALLRAGRFDKKIDIPLPDLQARTLLFEYFVKKIKACPDIDFTPLAKRTSGMTGADIKNLVNLAILNSIKEGRSSASREDFDFAYDRMVMGVYRKTLTMAEKTKIMTAYHEAGHTLVNLLTESGFKLHKVTILPVGQSLGHTAFIPSVENNQLTATQLLNMLDVVGSAEQAMGGRVAEELIFGFDELSTGCSQDLKQATGIANTLVRDMGFSLQGALQLSGQVDSMSEATNAQTDLQIEAVLRVPSAHPALARAHPAAAQSEPLEARVALQGPAGQRDHDRRRNKTNAQFARLILL